LSGGLTPKGKMSRSRTRSRRAQWKATPTTLTDCPNCGQKVRPHHACTNCGQYRTRTVAAAITTND